MKKAHFWLVTFLLFIPISGFSGEKEHLSFYDVFFGSEQDHMVCYPKDHRSFFYGIIMLSLAVAVLLTAVIYLKIRNNRKLQSKNDVIETKNRELLDSITYARRIQFALLPDLNKTFPAVRKVGTIYEPRDIVSGDLYWAHERDNLSFFAVIDCTGHGVPGAFLSLLAHNALNKAVIENGLNDPAEILTAMDAYVQFTLSQSEQEELKDGMEIGLCVIDKNEVKYAGANIRLVEICDGKLTEFRGAKTTIGSMTKNQMQLPKTNVVPLSGQARFYLFTDGFPDQFGGPKNKKFTSKRVLETLLWSSALTLGEQLNQIHSTFQNWKQNTEQTDDMLLMAFEV